MRQRQQSGSPGHENTHGKAISLGVLGLGQIGGSICSAVSKYGKDWFVRAFDPSEKLSAEARARNIIDGVPVDEAALIESSDILLIATHHDVALDTLTEYRDVLRRPKLILDVGSVKKEICRLARGLGFDNFIGGHPMAGTEKSAPEAWDADLFKNARFLYAEPSDVNPLSLGLFHQLVNIIGAVAVAISPSVHDHAFGITVGVPHVLAYALQKMKAEREEIREHLAALDGPSFRSATRVADSDSRMVEQMLWPNRKELVLHLARLEELLSGLRKSLERDDRRILRKLLNIQTRIR